MESIKPKEVRYIKLGRGGGWEEDCVVGRGGSLRIGFREVSHEFFLAGKWDKVQKQWVKAGKPESVATGFANQMRLVLTESVALV